MKQYTYYIISNNSRQPLCFFDVRFKSPCALQLAFCENPIFLGEVVKQYFLDIDGIFIIYKIKYY